MYVDILVQTCYFCLILMNVHWVPHLFYLGCHPIIFLPHPALGFPSITPCMSPKAGPSSAKSASCNGGTVASLATPKHSVFTPLNYSLSLLGGHLGSDYTFLVNPNSYGRPLRTMHPEIFTSITPYPTWNKPVPLRSVYFGGTFWDRIKPHWHKKSQLWSRFFATPSNSPWIELQTKPQKPNPVDPLFVEKTLGAFIKGIRGQLEKFRPQLEDEFPKLKGHTIFYVYE